MVKFNLDSKTKSIALEVMLDGEVEPLRISVNKYEITEASGKHYVEIHDVVTSRAWINTLIKQYLNNKKFELPNEYVSLLKMVV